MLLENDRLARRLALERDLERYTARSALLHEKVEQAESARAEAAAALDAAEAALASAQRLCRSIDAECASMRELIAFDPAVVDTLPSELLQAIWGHMCTSAYDARWRTIEDEDYDDNRAVVPGQVAAVCRRWRSVALRTPELWTYIAIPNGYKYHGRPLQPLLYHVQHQLEQSQPLGLKLVLLRDADSRRGASAGRSSGIEEILSMTSEHSQRWRSLKVKFATRPEAEFFARLMADRPTPLLEELYVAALEGAEVQSFSSAPSLKALGARGVRLCLPPGSKICSVVSASLTVHSLQTGYHFCDVLRALPSLAFLSLDLHFGFETFEHTSVPQISLPSLESLKLRGPLWMFEDIVSHIVVGPRLSKLNISPAMVSSNPDWGVRFFAVYPDVTALELEGDSSITFPRIRTLNALKRVQRVSLINCGFLRPYSHDLLAFCAPGRPMRRATVPSQQASESLPDPDVVDSESSSMGIGVDDSWLAGVVLPELQFLTIFAPRQLCEDVLNDILFLVRERAMVCEARGTSESFKLSLLSWPSPFPSWFREALGCVLGPENVYLTTADGISRAPVADDGQEDETEAEFTDSESAFDSVGSDDCASSGDETDYDRLDVHSDGDEE